MWKLRLARQLLRLNHAQLKRRQAELRYQALACQWVGFDYRQQRISKRSREESMSVQAPEPAEFITETRFASFPLTPR